MSKKIGCRIKVIKTGLFCEIEIGWNNGSLPFDWSKLENKMARLSIEKNGRWGFLLSGKNSESGITILEQNPISKNPDGSQTFNGIISLYGVKENFMNTVGCGKDLSGTGEWKATREAVEWKMFFPCS